jgi:hypothetical protein
MIAMRSRDERRMHDIGASVAHTRPPRAISVTSPFNTVCVPPSPIVPVKLFQFGEHKCTIRVHENISRDDLRKRASQEFQGRVAIQPDMFPIKEGATVVCCPSFVPETAKGSDKTLTVTPYLTRGDKLYPVEVPACATFEDMVIVTYHVM